LTTWNHARKILSGIPSQTSTGNEPSFNCGKPPHYEEGLFSKLTKKVTPPSPRTPQSLQNLLSTSSTIVCQTDIPVSVLHGRPPATSVCLTAEGLLTTRRGCFEGLLFGAFSGLFLTAVARYTIFRTSSQPAARSLVRRTSCCLRPFLAQFMLSDVRTASSALGCFSLATHFARTSWRLWVLHAIVLNSNTFSAGQTFCCH